MQLFSRSKKGLRRLTFLALLFSATTLAIPISGFQSKDRLPALSRTADLPPDELSWSLRVRPAPQCDLRPCFNAELYSNHFDQQPDLDRLAQEAVRQMLNSETFRSRLRSAEKEEIEKLLGGNNRDFGIEVSKFAKDPNPKPLSRPENDQATDQPKEEDYLFRISIFPPPPNSNKMMGVTFPEIELVHSRLWTYMYIEKDSGTHGEIFRDLWVKFYNGRISGSNPKVKKIGRAFKKFVGVLKGTELQYHRVNEPEY
ncbi:hypothetical protein F5878DRAFT_452186 [Lentinula raphanica]|uniref:Uncharacterized protein n=1 Tax=Lentinula raphanica TaxID=153919 RepID=A0AA38U584_9AGAR|nr:hypothetical protein F5878DRAFT_452186 [Lentinula raphanica]